MPSKTKTGAEPKKKVEPVDPVVQVLALEDALRAAADAVASGPNTDALKHHIRATARSIGDIRKTLETNASLA